MTRIPFILLSTSDGSPLTGAAPTVTISKDGGAFTSATNTPAEIGNGYYYVDLTTAETTVNNNAIVRATATGAQPTAIVWEPEATMPNIQSELTTYGAAKTSDLSGLATASTVANIATTVRAIKAKTDNLPENPAETGDAMTLTAAAVTAVQTGLALKSDIESAEDTIIGNIVAAMPDVSGLSTFNAATDTVTIDATQAAGMATATGFATPANITDAVTALETYGDGKWLTATGFATPSDIPSALDNASAVWSANSRTLTESALTAADVWSYSSRTLTASALTAQQVWEYGTRTLTESPTDLTGIATSQDIADLQTHGDLTWNTATGFATPTNVSDAKAEIISAIPTDYAKPGNAMTLTSSTLASVLTGVWNYENRSLTEEISVSITTEDINNICAGVWSYVPRRLTSIVSDVIEPNKS